MVKVYTDIWNDFQFREPVYLDGHHEAHKFDLVKWEEHEPYEVFDLYTGEKRGSVWVFTASVSASLTFDNQKYLPFCNSAWDTSAILYSCKLFFFDLIVSPTLNLGSISFSKVFVLLFHLYPRDLIASNNLSFSINDNLAQNGIEYEYAFVPVFQGIEGNYITNTIKSKFNGVFICDAESIYKFYTNVSYGTNERVQQIRIFEPFGRKYPVVVSNALLNYETGSFKGDILNNDFLETRKINAKEIVEKRKQIIDFLTNKKAKILKDWNGNFWLIFITDNIQTSYANNSGMSIVNVDAEWTEIGDANSGSDLYLNGILKEEQ